MSEIDRAMLQSMAASFRGALEFSFNRHDMAKLMDRCATRTDLSQVAVAAALEAAAVKSDDMATEWGKKREAAWRKKNATEEARVFDGMSLAALTVADAIRDLITPAQHDALAAHVAAEVAKARVLDGEYYADQLKLAAADAVKFGIPRASFLLAAELVYDAALRALAGKVAK